MKRRLKFFQLWNNKNLNKVLVQSIVQTIKFIIQTKEQIQAKGKLNQQRRLLLLKNLGLQAQWEKAVAKKYRQRQSIL